tara:strand:- start:672 stop:1340 length:669 start_codon:yes stop_codon:yes gene_type:complete
MGKRGILLLFLISFPAVFGATLSGTVYDLSLDIADKARVSIDTTPGQIVIASLGKYSFDVPQGDYMLTASFVDASGIESTYSENVSITDDGIFTHDIVLFPSIDDFSEPSVDFDDLEEQTGIDLLTFGLTITVLLFLLLLFRTSKKKRDVVRIPEKVVKEEEDVAAHVLSVIKKEGGRTTQKDIRKHIPLSEAKISLVIAQLEHEGKISKFKKGRGNVIVLK